MTASARLDRPTNKRVYLMFEVGKSYTITMWEDDDNHGKLTTHRGCKVIEAAIPLIKVKRSHAEPAIINTASLAFVQASIEHEEK